MPTLELSWCTHMMQLSWPTCAHWSLAIQAKSQISLCWAGPCIEKGMNEQRDGTSLPRAIHQISSAAPCNCSIWDTSHHALPRGCTSPKKLVRHMGWLYCVSNIISVKLCKQNKSYKMPANENCLLFFYVPELHNWTCTQGNHPRNTEKKTVNI